MSHVGLRSQGQQPPPATLLPQNSQLLLSDHPQPRRVPAGSSVTLKHHRLARDASLRASAGSVQAQKTNTSSSPRRNSSGDSHQTSRSDPKRWFDHSNENPAAVFDQGAMDVDPPFFQRETDSSDDKSYRYSNLPVPAKLQVAQSSSADDYRSVIDDLTVEIKKLKEELKRYKQQGPDMLRKDKLFEIKIHGLPRRKKRELETTLRDFASSLGHSSDAPSNQIPNPKHRAKDQPYSASASKHASSSSGSNFRVADSGYASMSTGAHSSGASLGRTTIGAKAGSTNDQKVERFLQGIPEGLFPKHTVMTDREKKKLVVRRLEHIFTGKFTGRTGRRNMPIAFGANNSSFLVSSEAGNSSQLQQEHYTQPGGVSQAPHPSGSLNMSTGHEPSREAKILPPNRRLKKHSSGENASTSHSQGDQTESGGNGNSNSSGGSGTNPSPPDEVLPEQRPTRVKDLDPDRAQIPSENMEYIRHLGLVAPELIKQNAHTSEDVRPDAEGWVYLNLLCNMAQLHILNVTNDFVRAAVQEVSTKLQLSPDRVRIRWRGGTDGTRFGSDVSGESSQRRPNTDDAESSDEVRKRQKLGIYSENDYQSASSGKKTSKFGPQVSGSESFHYKPIFVHRESSQEQTSLDDTLSSLGPAEESNIVESRWGQSGSGNSGRRKRRHDGAIIYYNGAPFCTDLCGEPGDASPTAYMMSSNRDNSLSDNSFVRPPPPRSPSGSSIQRRPLSDANHDFGQGTKMDLAGDNTSDLAMDFSDDDDGDVEAAFPWSNEPQFMDMQHLEPCGLGGVMPEDHFMVVVSTVRPKHESLRMQSPALTNGEITDGIIDRLAMMSTMSPRPVDSRSVTNDDNLKSVEIEYVSGRIKRLLPVSLPPPALFYPPFTSSSSAGDADSSSDDVSTGSEFLNKHVPQKIPTLHPHHSEDYPDNVDLSSGDEDGEEPEDELDARAVYLNHAEMAGGQRPETCRSTGSLKAVSGGTNRSGSASVEPLPRNSGSSAATAGEIQSGSESSGEKD